MLWGMNFRNTLFILEVRMQRLLLRRSIFVPAVLLAAMLLAVYVETRHRLAGAR
jgi:hypothetical protein